ncbi:hypothetical protein [Parasphingorhabdus sp.]|uniref:hypothetical protein n=1 Tax=Parasphingorhabdus sp. TaxID=2709688 RepID=UPI003A901EE7
MFKKIIARYFRPSTASALSGFRKSMNQLAQVIAFENAEIERLDAQIKRTSTKRFAAFSRRDDAAHFHAKLEEFLS